MGELGIVDILTFEISMDPMPLLDILDAHLSEVEMSALCRQFGVVFVAFPGGSKRDKTREFLGFVQRQGRMGGLAEMIIVLRPDLTKAIAGLYESKEQELSWLDQVAGGLGQSLDSGLTWRWTAYSTGRQAADGNEPATERQSSPDMAATEEGAPSSHSAENPYTPGARVIDESMFFGREAETEQIARLLEDGRHVAIVGHRGFGASSLLHQISRVSGKRDKVLVACADMKDTANHTSANLLNAIWLQWWDRVRPGNSAPVRTLAEFVTAVRKMNAAGFHPVLFVDELEQLTWRPANFDEGFFAAWHELGREGLVQFVVAAHSTPADVLAQAESQSTFYAIFQPVHLGLLDETAARSLLTIPIRRAEMSVPDGAVERLYLHAGPHPFFLHLAGLYLFDAIAGGNYSRGEVVRQFEIAAEPFWQELWESISPLAQSHYLAALMRMPVGMGGRQMRILANRGLVVAEDDGFRPFSDGFARWLARMQAAFEAAAAVTTATPL